MEKIKGVLLDVENNKVEVVEINKKLEDYYRILNCRLIEIVSRKIGKKVFDIIVDEEGALKDDPKISAINDYGYPEFVGNLFIVKFDGEEDETSLDDEEIKYVLKFVQNVSTKKYPDGYKMLVQVS